MHPQAHDWVAACAATARTVLDIGGRNINGTVRDLFPGTEYTALDIRPGDGVDIVADASTWTPTESYDVVVCCEVFEHAGAWPAIVRTAFKACAPGGWFIATMAGPGRGAHSAIDGGGLQPGEHYGNVAPEDLRDALIESGFADVIVDYQPSPADTRCVARRP